MTHVIHVHQHGGPEVLSLEPQELAPPGPREVRVRHCAIGLNFIDCYFRSGLYPPPGQPFVPGDVTELSRRGSLYLTRPTLADYVPTRPELLASATALFERIQDGTIRVADPSRYPLREAARAHTDLESRRTSGSVLLIP